MSVASAKRFTLQGGASKDFTSEIVKSQKNTCTLWLIYIYFPFSYLYNICNRV